MPILIGTMKSDKLVSSGRKRLAKSRKYSILLSSRVEILKIIFFQQNFNTFVARIFIAFVKIYIRSE